MRYVSLTFAALLGAATFAAWPAQAQPPGSYLRSCRDVSMHGDTLTAACRRMDRGWQRTRLDRVRRCLGDIGNDDGNLVCNRK